MMVAMIIFMALAQYKYHKGDYITGRTFNIMASVCGLLEFITRCEF